jgi:hypothetical protein
MGVKGARTSAIRDSAVRPLLAGYRRSQQKCEGQTQSDGMLTPPLAYRLS